MYTGVYQRKQAKQAVPSNKTGIPDMVKAHFEELSGYSFDDVRVHYSSDKPAQLMALAYTQGSQVYIAPGQERYLEHELTHVAQQKEGRVRPTRRINRIPVNDDPGLEREAELRWRRGRGMALAHRKAASQPAVLQGQFMRGRIRKEVYYTQIGKILERFRELGGQGDWEGYCGLGSPDADNDALFAGFAEKYGEIYGQLHEISQEHEELKLEPARLDILKNLAEHCRDGGQQYEHYHLYEDGKMVHDDNTEGAEAPVDADLASAIDCKRIPAIEKEGISLEKVFWIESFLSLQRGAGMQLLKEALTGREDVENVALGAYPGTEGYYTERLGMRKAEDVYVLDADGQVLDRQEAALMAKGILAEGMGEEEAAATDWIEKGLEEFYLYPLYYAVKTDLLAKIR